MASRTEDWGLRSRGEAKKSRPESLQPQVGVGVGAGVGACWKLPHSRQPLEAAPALRLGVSVGPAKAAASYPQNWERRAISESTGCRRAEAGQDPGPGPAAGPARRPSSQRGLPGW